MHKISDKTLLIILIVFGFTAILMAIIISFDKNQNTSENYSSIFEDKKTETAKTNQSIRREQRNDESSPEKASDKFSSQQIIKDEKSISSPGEAITQKSIVEVKEERIPALSTVTNQVATTATNTPQNKPVIIDENYYSEQEKRFTVIESLHEAAAMYSPEAIPLIETNLYSSDKEIRAAAADALVALGEVAGAEALRKAAKAAEDPREAVALIEKAEYLEIPPVPYGSLPQIQSTNN